MSHQTPELTFHPSQGGYPFSNAIQAGDFVYVSGQIAFEANGAVSTGPIEQQTTLVLEQLKAILKQAGCTLGDVVKCGCTLQDARDFAGFNKVYATYFPHNPPTRTTLVPRPALTSWRATVANTSSWAPDSTSSQCPARLRGSSGNP